MRIALFGGSFDPPHRGHLAIARAAARQYSLDQVLLAPTGLQPLKPGGPVASFADRLAMVGLLCAEDLHLSPSNIDAPLPDHRPNYTVDTLRRLREQYSTANLFNLIGADSFNTLGHWHEPHHALALAEWIVVSRPGYTLADPEGLSLTPDERTRIHLLDTIHEDVSATALRARLALGDPCPGLLPGPIAAYIQHYELYQSR